MSLLLPAFRPDLRHPGVEIPPSESPWAQWNKFSVIELACRNTFDFFHSRLAACSRVVDIGCGNGYLSLELAREGHDVVGLDVSEEAIAIAKTALSENTDEILGKLEHVVSDFWTWEPEGAFDAILFNRSLHHVDRLDEVVRRCRSFLKPGGKILLSDFAADGIDEKWKAWAGTDLEGHGHDLGEMIAALHDAFEQAHYSVEPYLFSVRANRELTDDWQVTKRFYDEEKDLLLRGDYKPVGFRWVGIKR